ncbi:hypothetical protein EUX98_g2156 [Antrodiella citrinella]|uniref:Uncharacterized protein n=1 Tax=Antrodiella citrinella TaxID=2447956 RepID=A0A4S4N2K9_9APHY|nr:hypothetical protein EUX98_g2156 [Antrodiella citrinella]
MASRLMTATLMQTEKTHARSASRTKCFERRLVHAWKAITRITRGSPNRMSISPEDFVILTNRRRSIRF